MGSLAGCLDRHKISGIEADIIRKAAKVHREVDKYSAQEANELAVSDILSKARITHKELLASLGSLLTEDQRAEVFPAAKKVAIAKEEIKYERELEGAGKQEGRDGTAFQWEDIKEKEPGVIEDFGQKIEGARKDMVAAMRKEYSDDDLASLPLSKIWPADLSDKIEDPYVAAIAFAARAEIPSKPRQAYKVKRWVEQVKVVRSLAEKMLSSTMIRAKAEALLNESVPLKGFAAKVSLLEAIDRNQWSRIGKVSEYPDAYKYGEGKEKIPSPMVNVQIDGLTQTFSGASSVADVIEKVNKKLGVEKQAAKMKFEVRGSLLKGYFINKAGDSEYRKLKTFETGKEALDYRNTNYNDLVAAWEDVKERDNVKKADVRREENRPRTAEDYRKGKDITTEEFGKTFGFRGGQFGKWVSQGSNAKERQWMINNAYDAFMDLSTILNIPPKAISLNGELGIAFGARGSGAASAHYESDEIVINLTKTRGAGTLAHEWFHALDNYFQRARGIKGVQREGRFVTYSPEALYVSKDRPTGMKLQKAELERRHKRDVNNPTYDPKNWQPDPTHPEGVRPEVEARFSELVESLNESPMTKRSAVIDAGKADGYWSRIIERAARSFENYIIAKMAEKGYNNDYLANVVNVNEFKRDMGRYPYLKDEELAPVVEAFDNLFGEIKATETAKGISLGSGFGALQDSYEALEKITVAKLKEAIPHLENIGNSVYKAGMKYADFAKAMKTALGDMWNKFKAQMGRVYLGVKAKFKEERGSIPVVEGKANEYQERVIAAQDFVEEAKSVGRRVNINIGDGTVTLYHGTSPLNAESIRKSGKINEQSFLSLTEKETKEHIQQHQKKEVLTVKVDPRDIEFSTGTQEVYAPEGLVLDRNSGIWQSPKRTESPAFSRARSTVWITQHPASKEWLAQSGMGAQGRILTKGSDKITVMKAAKELAPDSDIRVLTASQSLLSRAEGKGPGLGISQVESSIAPILKGWKNAPDVITVDSIDSLPDHLQDYIMKSEGEGDIEGLFDPKTKAVYLVAGNIDSKNRALEVLLHESFGHFGLRGMMGESIKPLLNVVWREKNAEAREIARRYKLKVSAEGIEGQNARQTAAEEVLANMAMEVDTPPLLKRIMSAIRNWMRKVGFNITLTDDDLKKIVYDSAQYVRTGEKPLSLTGMVAYSRREEAKTDTPEFKKWFGDSKVVDEDGKPLVVYHGTEKAGFASFDYDKGSFARGKETHGYHFTENRLTASTYSGGRAEAVISGDEDFDPRYEGESGIYSTYLKMKNPYEIDFADKDGNEQGWDTEVDGFFGVDDVAKFAKDNGYDGVIVRNVMDEGPHGQGYGWGNKTYIVFEPTQIKSIFNRGTFDPNAPNILLSRSTEGSKLASRIEADRASGNFATEEELKAEGYSEQEEEAYRKLTEEDDNIDHSGHLLAKDKKEIWADAKKVADRALGIISTRLGNIHPRIKAIFREHQRDLAKGIAEDHISAKPFIAKFKKLPKKIRIILSNALLDGRFNDADIIARRHNLFTEMKVARRIFDTTRNRAIEAGLEVGKIDNYWARVVKNPKKLLAAIRGTEHWSGIDAAIRRIEKEKGPLSEVEKSIIIDQVLRGYPANTISLTSTSHLKERKFKQIPKAYLEYYMPADQSLLSYITSMNNTIEAAKFFGKSKKPRYDEFIAGVRKQAGEAAREENRQTGKMSRTDYWDAYNKFVSKAIKEAKLEADINPEIVTEVGLDDSIGTLINDLMNKDLLDPAKEQDIRDMAQAVFRPARTGYGVRAYKNLTYLQLLTQFTPAITQIQDIALAAEAAGYWNVLKVAGKVIGKNLGLREGKEITTADIHIERIMEELDEGQDVLSNLLRESLKWTGFTTMDRIGKEILLNAKMLQFQQQAQTNDPKLRALVDVTFAESNPDQVMKDLAAGIKNDDTNLMLFNAISDMQPITALEVPEKYHTAKGIGKTFYALKTYQLKLFDVYRRDVWNEYKNGNKVEAGRKLVLLTSAMILMGMGTDEIKDFILGREVDWDDRIIDNGLKLFGFSKYTIYKVRKEGIGQGLLAQFAPPLGIVDPLSKDVDEFLRKGELEKGARSTANVPVAGKMYYWWLGRGAEQKAEDAEKRQKEERIRKNLGEAGFKRYQKAEEKKALITRLKSDRTKALNRADTSEEKRRIVVKFRQKFIDAREE